MTELIYLEDSYQKEFDATVVGHDVDQHGILLDRTAFYPGGGGQLPDQGVLRAGDSRFRVSKVRRGNVHIIDGDLPLVGTEARGAIDWERRYKIMRTHTAMHILCGVIWRDYQASVTGGNMDILSGRMDFEFERLAPEVVKIIEERINLEVKAAREGAHRDSASGSSIRNPRFDSDEDQSVAGKYQASANRRDRRPGFAG